MLAKDHKGKQKSPTLIGGAYASLAPIGVHAAEKFKRIGQVPFTSVAVGVSDLTWTEHLRSPLSHTLLSRVHVTEEVRNHSECSTSCAACQGPKRAAFMGSDNTRRAQISASSFSPLASIVDAHRSNAVLVISWAFFSLLVMSTSPSDGASVPRGKPASSNMLFLRHIPQASSEISEAGLSMSTSQHNQQSHYRSYTAAGSNRFNYHGGQGGYQQGRSHPTLKEDTEDISKSKPLNGRNGWINLARDYIRRTLEVVWTPGSQRSGVSGGSSSTNSASSSYLRWRRATQDLLGLGGNAGAANTIGGGTRHYKVHHSHNSFQPPPQPRHARHLLAPRGRVLHPGKVGSLLLAAHPTSGEAGSAGFDGGMLGDRDEEGGKPHHRTGSSALDRISINMTLEANLREGVGGQLRRDCPVELIAPCAVPSASLVEHNVLREEGLVVPASFLVGDVVDFITRMSKLERYNGGPGDGREAEGGGGGPCRSLERIFVTDCGRLVGYVTSMDLLVQDRAAPLLSIVRSCEVVVRDSDEYDDAIGAMRAKRLTYAPVVTEDEVVVGIITPSDMLKEMEMEATDDVSRYSGSGSTESFFGTPVLQLVTARASWLVSLLMLQSLSSIILTHFSALIERHLVIALFLTMLTGTAGNAGNQSSAMVIRGIATGEINRKNGWKAVVREVKAALLMSALLAVAAFLRVYITPGSTVMSTVAVTLALSVTVVGACAFGTVAPLVMDRLGVDPANCASPALSTLVDVGGVLVLCALSSAMLG